MPYPIKSLPRRFKLSREDGLVIIKAGGAPNFMPYLLAFLAFGSLAATGLSKKEVNVTFWSLGSLAAAGLMFSLGTMLKSPHVIISKTMLMAGQGPKARPMKFQIPLAEIAKVWDEDADPEGSLSYVFVESLSGQKKRLPVPLQGAEETSYIVAQIQKAMADAQRR